MKQNPTSDFQFCTMLIQRQCPTLKQRHTTSKERCTTLFQPRVDVSESYIESNRASEDHGFANRWIVFVLLNEERYFTATKLIKRRQNLSLQSTFPIKLYQSEEDPPVGQILDKDVQCFLCLVVSSLKSEKKLILHFLEKIKTEAVAQRCSVKQVFLEISQNSQENTCAIVSFLQALDLQRY